MQPLQAKAWPASTGAGALELLLRPQLLLLLLLALLLGPLLLRQLQLRAAGERRQWGDLQMWRQAVVCGCYVLVKMFAGRAKLPACTLNSVPS
jgi:hypothetical protein